MGEAVKVEEQRRQDRERSQKGAKRTARDEEIWRQLDEEDTDEGLTREEFAQRFGA